MKPAGVWGWAPSADVTEGDHVQFEDPRCSQLLSSCWAPLVRNRGRLASLKAEVLKLLFVGWDTSPPPPKKREMLQNPKVNTQECSPCDLQEADIPPEPAGDVKPVMFSLGSLFKFSLVLTKDAPKPTFKIASHRPLPSFWQQNVDVIYFCLQERKGKLVQFHYSENFFPCIFLDIIFSYVIVSDLQ